MFVDMELHISAMFTKYGFFFIARLPSLEIRGILFHAEQCYIGFQIATGSKY